MKCILCGKDAEYTTFWDAPSPVCEECAHIEGRKIWKKLNDNNNFELDNFYNKIPTEHQYSIFASTLDLNTNEVK